MPFSFIKSVRWFDDFGHPIALTYKGKDSHQSFLGGFITLMMMLFTATMVVIKIDHVVSMSEPTISSFSRPLSEDHREELGTISMKDYHFNIGYSIVIQDKSASLF